MENYFIKNDTFCSFVKIKGWRQRIFKINIALLRAGLICTIKFNLIDQTVYVSQLLDQKACAMCDFKKISSLLFPVYFLSYIVFKEFVSIQVFETLKYFLCATQHLNEYIFDNFDSQNQGKQKFEFLHFPFKGQTNIYHQTQ